jgi:hypothetical protein
VATSESDIEDIAALSEDTGLGEALISLVEEPSLYTAVTSVIAVLSTIVGSLTDAVATGAGIGGLIEVNIRHHVGLYSVIQGETV